MKPPLSLLMILASWIAVLWLRAEPFTVVLELQGQQEKQTATNAPALHRSPAPARRVFHARLNEPLKVRFSLSLNEVTTLEDMLVHLYVAPEEQLNQMRPPDLKPDRVVLESALTMDLKTNRTVRANFSFRVDKPGIYLVRVEGLDTADAGIEEPFAAMDLEVKENATP